VISTRVRLAALVAALVVPSGLPAQVVHLTPRPEARAVHMTGEFLLDGRLDDAVWQAAQPATDLRQNQPHEGQPATQRTEVRFAFDDAAIYVGARMFDDRGAAGVRTRLVRRDGDINSDYVEVIFDTYHDHIGRLFFLVNPSGVKSDANGLGGGGDNSWDPVWEVKTVIDTLGWTAEMRIPLSQMRFPATRAEQTWGLQIWRQVNRLNELSQWAWWGIQEAGGPPFFGHLSGLVLGRAPGKAELLPYMVGRSANAPVQDAADPFEDPHALDGRAGVDARILLTSNLTLNATVNPDFGQVEVDPAVVNLSAFETFFEERRPFFIEGAGYFGFGGLSCYFCSNVSSLSMFYTRRVGRSPQMTGNAFASGGQFADLPENTTILGAAKLTGRTPSGWSIGLMDAVTRRERATFERADSTRGEATVEPLSNYFVGRVAKDLRGGATVIRAMGTSVWRDLDDPYLDARLSRHSEAFGLSTDMWFGKRDYRLMAQIAGTQVSGSASAIARLDTSSARYLQRPDRDGAPYVPGRTSMTGLGAYTRFSRETGHMLWEVSTNIRTPSFENNDISFLSQADYYYMSANVLPQWTKPTKTYRNLFFIAGGQQRYNFDGDMTDRQVHLYAYMQLLNYWDGNVFYLHRPSLYDDRLSRGGPLLKRPGVDVWSINLSSDRRKNIAGNAGSEINRDGDGFWDISAYLNLTLQPASNVTISLGPSYFRGTTGVQYVLTRTDATATTFYGRRYVFADLLQKSISMNTRFNVTFSPTLSLELFMQPLISSGAFSRFKEYAAPRGLQRLVYGEDVGTASIQPGPPDTPDQVVIDPDGGGPAAQFAFRDPSFTFRSLRGNAVLRWEYRPGSTLFLVWSRDGSSSLTRGRLDFGEDLRALFEGPSTNIFLIKVSYWLGI
jgi:hypothetical protein